MPGPLLARDGTPAADLWMLDPRRIHLNHGSFGASPRFAHETRMALLAELESNPLQFYLGLSDRLAEARAAVALFVGAEPDELAFVPNASAGTTLLLRAMRLEPGQELLLTDHAYGAVTLSARRRAEDAGATVRVVPVPLKAGPDETVARIESAITPATAGIVLDHLTSPTARWLPVDRIAATAAEYGIPLIVDAAHSPGVLDRAAAGPAGDAWVGNLHKFAVGQRGTAALVVRADWARDRVRPLIDSWAAEAGFPAAFDGQGTVDATPMLATAATIPWVEEVIGWDRIREHVGRTLEYGERVVGAALGEGSAVDLGMPVPTMRLLRIPGGDHPDADAGSTRAAQVRQRIADELGVESQLQWWSGATYLRLSGHAYTVDEHFDAFADRAVPQLLRWIRA